jgi:TPR repeat protein
LYAMGRGVPKDVQEARRWLKKAADAGNEKAIELMKTK